MGSIKSVPVRVAALSERGVGQPERDQCSQALREAAKEGVYRIKAPMFRRIPRAARPQSIRSHSS
jgi:hypothetical protein